MRFICDSCRAQYMISDDKVGAKGAKVRCKKCGHVILVRRAEPGAEMEAPALVPSSVETEAAAAASAVGGSPTSDTSTPITGRNKQLSGAEILSGVDDEEIGAVFDQALSMPDEAPAAPTNGATPDSGEALRELASQQQGETTPAEPRAWDMAAPAPVPASAPAVARPEPEPVAVHEWYVAIDEKQIGPIGMEKVKAFWDSGEVGPDSLCWRAGLPDWQPLSEVKELFSILAPKPTKPVIIAAPQAPQPAVTAPVESVLTGSPSKTILAPPAPEPAEAGGSGWRPSAASTLASLMKEEIEALSKPAAPTAAAPISSPGASARTPSLVDVPSGPVPIPGPVPITMGSLHYTPVRHTRRGWMVALGVGGLVLLIAVAVLATMLFTRTPSTGQSAVERAQLPVFKPQGAPANEPPKVATQTPPSAQQKPPGGSAAQPGSNMPPGSTAQPPEATAKATPPPPQAKTGAEVASPERSSSSDSRRERGGGRRRTRSTEEPAPAGPEKGEVITRSEPQRSSADDDFERVFGGGQSERKSAKPEQKRSASVYVPPPPGTVDTPDSLGQSDVMQVVVSNKPSILGCVAEQKKRDPNLSGRIVMRWTIHTNGKVSNVSCQSDEFKSTYIASCIAGLIKGWSFPKHKVQGDPINFPFTF